jgi:L-lactate dehydrogenase complex protein LldG
VARELLGELQPSGASAEVVAAAEFAVAETGSVCLNEPAPDRGACLLAERLWVLVRTDQIVPTLDAALDRLGELIRAGAPHAILMTGPSRTADIERTLTVGVHGPRAVVIVVLE